MNQLSEQLKEALNDAGSDDAEKLKRAAERASTAVWAANKIVKATTKKFNQLNKQLQKAQKTYQKLQKAHQLCKQRVTRWSFSRSHGSFIQMELQTNIFTLTDSIKPDLSKDRVVRLVPKISADIQAEAAGGSYGYDYDYDSDEDDEVSVEVPPKVESYKYGNSVEKLMKSFDKTVKKFETDTKTRNKTLIDNLGVYGDILVKLSGVNDLVKTYIDDAERLQEYEIFCLPGKINVSINEWRRTTLKMVLIKIERKLQMILPNKVTKRKNLKVDFSLSGK